MNAEQNILIEDERKMAGFLHCFAYGKTAFMLVDR